MGIRLHRAAIFSCIWIVCTQASQESSMPPVLPGDAKSWSVDSFKSYHPLAPTLASLLLPGAGQVYTRHYVKGPFFAASEGILGATAYAWRSIGIMRESEERALAQKAESAASPEDSTAYREESFLWHHRVIEARLATYDFLAWSLGAHLLNVLDALGGSNYFRNADVRSPTIALLLAAVPGLGLGQIYNGAIAKTGFIVMCQVSLGVMAFNSHRLMKRAETDYQRLNAATADSLTKTIAGQYSSEWGGARHRAFTNRNMYLWYSVFFYFYSVLDAVVDANLHDYPEKMKIEPDLVADGKGVRFSLHTHF